MDNSVKIPSPFCMKRGEKDLSQILKSLQTIAARYPLTEEERDSKQDVVDILYDKGWHKLESLFSNEIDLIDNIKDKLDFYLDKGGKDCKYGLLKDSSPPQSEARESELFMSVQNPLYNVPEIGEILFDDRIVDIAKCYFKCMPAVGTLNLRKSFANNLPDAQTTLFHCDRNSPYML